jgi:hypothetical protein
MSRFLLVPFAALAAYVVITSPGAISGSPASHGPARASGSEIGIDRTSATASVMPMWSNAFVDTIGVNSHFSFARSLGHDSTQSVLNGFVTLGIRHIRQDVAPTARGRIQQLIGLGIKFDVPLEHCVTGLPKGPEGATGRNPGKNAEGYAGDDFFSPTAWMDALNANMGFANVDSVEECNEPNGPGNGGYDLDWQANIPQQAAAFNRALSSHGIAFLAPAFAIDSLSRPFATPAPRGFRPNFGEQNGIAFQHLHPSVDISRYFTYQNIHVYSQRWPGFDATDSGLNVARIIAAYTSATNPTVNAAHLPFWVTEAGWSHDPHDGPWVPMNILARWVPLLFLDHYRMGVQRTYLFNDVDATPYLGPNFTHYGLMTYTVGASEEPGGDPAGGASPTAEFTALENFINLLRDPAPAFEPTKLWFSIAGGEGMIRSQLFEKSNGVYLLALWKNEEDYVPSRSAQPQAQRVIRPEHVTVAVADTRTSVMDSAVTSVFNDAGGFSNTSLSGVNCNGSHCFTLDVSTNLTILQIAPKGFTPQTPVPSPTAFGSSTPTPMPVVPLAPTPRPRS